MTIFAKGKGGNETIFAQLRDVPGFTEWSNPA